MTLSFGIVLLILRKFAWKPILSTIKEREKYIAGAIRQSKKIQRELAEIDTTKEKLLLQAREEANEVIKKAKAEGEELIEKAHAKARKEANQIIEAARNSIIAERKAAEKEIREQIVLLSMDVAQNVIREEFADMDKKNKYINKLMEDIQLN
jgi:F-type H+-transporting ATPase subunit b